MSPPMVSKEQARDFFQMVDTSGDGNVSIKELIDCMSKVPGYDKQRCMVFSLL